MHGMGTEPDSGGSDWFEQLHDSLWLRPDEGGEEEADCLRRMLSIRRGQRVLDAPCGAGRVAFHLANRGVQVVGIDLRKSFIDRAKRRFRREGVKADLRCMDLRAVEFEDEFDAVCNWFISFGYFSDRENAEVVMRFSRALRPGGRLLIEQLNRERILRNFRPEEVRDGARLPDRGGTAAGSAWSRSVWSRGLPKRRAGPRNGSTPLRRCAACLPRPASKWRPSMVRGKGSRTGEAAPG